MVATAASYTDFSLISKKMGAQRKEGRRKEERRLADFVFKMAECLMADDSVIFKMSVDLLILHKTKSHVHM